MVMVEVAVKVSRLFKDTIRDGVPLAIAASALAKIQGYAQQNYLMESYPQDLVTTPDTGQQRSRPVSWLFHAGLTHVEKTYASISQTLALL